MDAEAPQGGAQVYQTRSIESQACHGGAADRSDADNERGVAAPGKMIRPTLQARMKQRCSLPGYRVDACLKRTFEAIASEACQSKVLFQRCATGGFGHDVVDRERIWMEFPEAAAVFTLASCPLTDQTLKGIRYSRARHLRRQRDLELACDVRKR